MGLSSPVLEKKLGESNDTQEPPFWKTGCSYPEVPSVLGDWVVDV
jgi:hypothetical protein